MEPTKIVDKYDEAPRKRPHEASPDNERIRVAYELSVPVFGKWTHSMLSSMRRMWGEADRAGDSSLKKRVEAAYDYLYKRDQRVKCKRKKKKPRTLESPSTWNAQHHQQEKTP